MVIRTGLRILFCICSPFLSVAGCVPENRAAAPSADSPQEVTINVASAAFNEKLSPRLKNMWAKRRSIARRDVLRAETGRLPS